MTNLMKRDRYGPAGAPAWVNETLIGQTLDTWHSYYERQLTCEDGVIKVICGIAEGVYGFAGITVAAVQRVLGDIFNISKNAIAFVNGEPAASSCRLQNNDTLEFVRVHGRKAVGGRVWSGEDFCRFFGISAEDLGAWTAEGLKVKRCLDGSIRITESATDDFFRGKSIDSPYLNTEQAAAYCNVTKDAFYGRVERKKIKPLPGSGKENLFTREQCDRMMKGDAS